MSMRIIIKENKITGKFDLFVVSDESSYEMKIKNVNCTTQSGAEKAVERYKKLFNINQ